MFVDGCTDFLFDKRCPPALRVPHDEHPVGGRRDTALAIVQTWPKSKRIAPYPSRLLVRAQRLRSHQDRHEEMMPVAEIVSEGWPKLAPRTSPRTSRRRSPPKPDLIVSSVWGGDYVALYKQALRYGHVPEGEVRDHAGAGRGAARARQGSSGRVIAGVHSNYHFTVSAGDKWPYNKTFVEPTTSASTSTRTSRPRRVHDDVHAQGRHREGQPARGRLARGRRDHRDARRHDDGGAGGLRLHRPDNHQGYKDALIGFSKNTDEYPFPVLDPARIITDSDPLDYGASRLAQGERRRRSPGSIRPGRR